MTPPSGVGIPTAGFRDLNMNLLLSTGHVAEVQVHHAGIKAFEDQHHSHQHYEVRRQERPQAARYLSGTCLLPPQPFTCRTSRCTAQYFRTFFKGGTEAVEQRLEVREGCSPARIPARCCLHALTFDTKLLS